MKRALVIACTLPVACGGEAAPPPSDLGPATGRAPSLESLASLGYAHWDEASEDDHAPGALRDRGRVQPWPRAWADDRSQVHVIDVDGAPLRTITVPGRTQVEFARFLPGGRILCLSVDEGLTLLEADGGLVWHADLPCHHDVAVVPNGRPAGERLFAVAVHGPHPWRGRAVRFDEVAFVEERTGLESETQPRWSTAVRRGALMELVGRVHPLDQPPPPPTSGSKTRGTVYDYFHLNSITFDGPGTMLVCLRNVDLIARVDVRSGTSESVIPPGLLDWPHAPSIVDRDGAPTLLVFDNGYHRGWSRVLETDPATGEILWEFRGSVAEPLFSAVRGYAQRLPNGNTLITESERGRVLEVTEEGETLWEFWNPETRQTPAGTSRRRIYRMTAVPPGS